MRNAYNDYIKTEQPFLTLGVIMLDQNLCFKLPVTRGNQHKSFFQVVMPLENLVTLLRFDDKGTVLERSQRPLNKTRAKSVAKYVVSNMINNQFLIIPSLCGVIDSPEDEAPVYVASEMHPDVGVLNVSLGAIIKLFDGQHRAGGCSIGMEELQDLVNAAKVDKSILKKLKRLNIPLMLHTDLTLEERQQAFTDINQNGTKANAALNFTYNTRDPLPTLGRMLANDCLCFQNMVDYEHNTPDAAFLFSIKAITDSTSSLIGYKKGSKISEKESQLAFDYWHAVSKAMGWSGLGFALDPSGENSPAGYKSKNVKTHTIMTQALGHAGKQILDHFGSLDAVTWDALGALNYSRDPSQSDFTNRCIDPVTNTMLTKRHNKVLTSNLLLKVLGVPLLPADADIEQMYFPISEDGSSQVTATENHDTDFIQVPESNSLDEQESDSPNITVGDLSGIVTIEESAQHSSTDTSLPGDYEQGDLIGDMMDEFEDVDLKDISIGEVKSVDSPDMETMESNPAPITINEFFMNNGDMLDETFRALIGDKAPTALTKAQSNFQKVLTETFGTTGMNESDVTKILNVVQANIDEIGEQQTKVAFNTVAGTRTMLKTLEH